MTYDFKVKSLTLKPNTPTPQTIPLESKKIIVFVGPNNAGKSTALKEIRRAALAEDGYYLPTENHGFRSFVATYLVLKCGRRPLLLLDEPEAFLHPPQTKRLAQIIGEAANEESSQIFIATHSRDILGKR